MLLTISMHSGNPAKGSTIAIRREKRRSAKRYESRAGNFHNAYGNEKNDCQYRSCLFGNGKADGAASLSCRFWEKMNPSVICFCSMWIIMNFCPSAKRKKVFGLPYKISGTWSMNIILIGMTVIWKKYRLLIYSASRLKIPWPVALNSRSFQRIEISH